MGRRPGLAVVLRFFSHDISLSLQEDAADGGVDRFGKAPVRARYFTPPFYFFSVGVTPFRASGS